ncbi:MAG: putative toxin-antitoxin system toxin component, PIN family [Steroidobacteraceae bacterium]
MSTALKLVLDTNVVLDWLVFADALSTGFDKALQDERIILHTHPLTLAELERVLNYPILKLDSERQAQTLARYKSLGISNALATGFTANDLQLPDGFPQCKDVDDQVFLALAYHTQADALITRDKAVLALRKRARKFGVKIVAAESAKDLIGSAACHVA